MITTEQLAELAERVRSGRCVMCDDGPGRITCSMCEGTGAFALKTEVMLEIIDELIERRKS